MSRPQSAPPLPLFSLSVLLYGVMALLAVGIAWWCGHLHLWVNPETVGADLAIGAAIGVGIVLISRLATGIPAFRQVSLELGQALDELRPWQMAVVAGLSGMAEEALFRGAFPPRLGIGMVIATLVFGSIHIGPAWRYLWWTLFALSVGALFIALYVWRGNLVAPVVAHATVNLLNIPYLVRMSRTSRR